MKLNGRWFPQIVDRDSGNLYPIYPPFHVLFYAISNMFRKPMFPGGGGKKYRVALFYSQEV